MDQAVIIRRLIALIERHVPKLHWHRAGDARHHLYVASKPFRTHPERGRLADLIDVPALILRLTLMAEEHIPGLQWAREHDHNHDLYLAVEDYRHPVEPGELGQKIASGL
jgi:hypothetical protein